MPLQGVHLHPLPFEPGRFKYGSQQAQFTKHRGQPYSPGAVVPERGDVLGCYLWHGQVQRQLVAFEGSQAHLFPPFALPMRGHFIAVFSQRLAQRVQLAGRLRGVVADLCLAPCRPFDRLPARREGVAVARQLDLGTIALDCLLDACHLGPGPRWGRRLRIVAF